MAEPGDLVRIIGHRGTYRVHSIDEGEVTMFGGTHRQWRTVTAAKIRKATKRERTLHLKNEQALLEAARGIKPAPPIKRKRGQT